MLHPKWNALNHD